MDLPTMVLDLWRRVYELDRRVHNMVRPARVTEVDYDNALCKVSYALDENDQDVVTGWIPWATSRAGEINKWEPPSKDEQVMLLNFSGEPGPMSVVLSSLYSEKYKPPHNKGAEKRTTVRKNNENDEPDDNYPAMIVNYKATDKEASRVAQAQDKYKNRQTYIDRSQSYNDGKAEDVMEAKAQNGAKNQVAHSPGGSQYDNPGGSRAVSHARIDYVKKVAQTSNPPSGQYQTAEAPTNDPFANYEDGHPKA